MLIKIKVYIPTIGTCESPDEEILTPHPLMINTSQVISIEKMYSFGGKTLECEFYELVLLNKALVIDKEDFERIKST